MGDSNKLAYNEGCEAIRHYSNALKHIRAVAIAQGIAVITGSSLLAADTCFDPASLLASMAGLVLTVILYFLNMNYYTHVRSAQKYVRKCEQSEFDSKWGPWNEIEKEREKLWNKRYFEFLANKAIYILLFVVILINLIFNLSF
jgi:hypothetical protein